MCVCVGGCFRWMLSWLNTVWRVVVMLPWGWLAYTWLQSCQPFSILPVNHSQFCLVNHSWSCPVNPSQSCPVNPSWSFLSTLPDPVLSTLPNPVLSTLHSLVPSTLPDPVLSTLPSLVLSTLPDPVLSTLPKAGFISKVLLTFIFISCCALPFFSFFLHSQRAFHLLAENEFIHPLYQKMWSYQFP